MFSLRLIKCLVSIYILLYVVRGVNTKNLFQNYRLSFLFMGIYYIKTEYHMAISISHLHQNETPIYNRKSSGWRLIHWVILKKAISYTLYYIPQVVVLCDVVSYVYRLRVCLCISDWHWWCHVIQIQGGIKPLQARLISISSGIADTAQLLLTVLHMQFICIYY